MSNNHNVVSNDLDIPAIEILFESDSFNCDLQHMIAPTVIISEYGRDCSVSHGRRYIFQKVQGSENGCSVSVSE